MHYIGLLALTSACALAPLTDQGSARTLGEGNSQLSASISPVLGANLAYSLKEHTDIGISAELQTSAIISVWIKQQFLDTKSGHAFAVNTGIYGSSGGVKENGYT